MSLNLEWGRLSYPRARNNRLNDNQMNKLSNTINNIIIMNAYDNNKVNLFSM